MIWFGKQRLRHLVRRADAARDLKQFADAARLYQEAVVLAPNRAGIHIQLGHMLKEIGKLNDAEVHYEEAKRLRPDDADLALQLGHFYKRANRWGEALESYQRALALRPGWHEPERESAALLAHVTLPSTLPDEAVAELAPLTSVPTALAARTAADLMKLVPGLAPRAPADLFFDHAEEIAIRQLGRRETTFWGNRRVLRGLEAIRGFYIATRPIVEVQIILDGVKIHQGPLKGGYPLARERDQDRARKYVFNYWIDFSGQVPGLHQLDIVFYDALDRQDRVREDVVIAEPVPEAAYPDSNFLISLDQQDGRSIEEQVSSRPSMVRPASRMLFERGIHNVLVIRTDQLGDMVASIPAFLRLRELLPDARLVGLFNYANAELARTMSIVDEIITIDFPDDPLERRRIMSIGNQEMLRAQLEPFQFDIAIDFAQAQASRSLLQLAGAKFTYGTGGEDWPWLTSDFQFHTRDRWTRHDFTPHSTKVLALVNSLGALLTTSAPIIRRRDITRSIFESYGLPCNARFAVLHTGARIGFSRWPHYGELTSLLLRHTSLHVVIITEDPSFRVSLPPEILDDPRVLFLEGRLPFDHFDAFLSFATVMAGNDSGPKHLASLRGTPVVTIFSARINWTEWGQENVGVVVSRKLPCAGCALLHDPEECGKDFVCVTDIKASEILDAMNVYISEAGGNE